MAFWGLWRSEEENQIIDFIREHGEHRAQWHGGATDIDASFRASGGEFALDIIDHMSPGTTAVTNAIRADADTMAAFDALVRDEGKEVLTELEGLMQDADGQPVDPQVFAQMLQDPVQRDLFNQALLAGATEEHDMGDLINFARSSVALSRDPLNADRRARFDENAQALGIDTSEIESQNMMGMMQQFLRNPSGALLNMGLDPQLVAALEPLIRFFTEALDYYINGTPGQPGLAQIFGSVVEGSGPATAQLLKREGRVEQTDDVGEIVMNERGVKMRVYDAPAGADQSVDLDSSAHGRQVHTDIDGDGQREIVTVVGDRAYVPATEAQIEAFTSAGGAQIQRPINLGRAFVDAVDAVQTPAREPGFRQTGAAADFSSGVTAAAPGVP